MDSLTKCNNLPTLKINKQLPKNKSEASSNWKILSKTIKKEATWPIRKPGDRRKAKMEKVKGIDSKDKSVISPRPRPEKEKGVDSKDKSVKSKPNISPRSEKENGIDSKDKSVKSKPNLSPRPEKEKGIDSEDKSVKSKTNVSPRPDKEKGADSKDKSVKSKPNISPRPNKTSETERPSLIKEGFELINGIIFNGFKFPAYGPDGRCLTPRPLPPHLTRETRCYALDCEMVGVGPTTEESALARVSIVNEFGFCFYDKYVCPRVPVTDYRTAVSGIRPEHLTRAPDITVIMSEVAAILQNRIIVGHSINCDLSALMLRVPRHRVRDTAYYFKRHGRKLSLKQLTLELLGVEIQTGEHNPIEDAQAAMKLYLEHSSAWEYSLRPEHVKRYVAPCLPCRETPRSWPPPQE